MHLSVLDAGALLIVATLVEKISVQPVAPWLLGCSALMSCASLAAAASSCLRPFGGPLAGSLERSGSERGVPLGMVAASLVGFLGSVTCLASFLYLNWLGQQWTTL